MAAAVEAVESVRVVGASVAGSVVPGVEAVDAAGVVVTLTLVVEPAEVVLWAALLLLLMLLLVCPGLRVVPLVLCALVDVLCGCVVAFLASPTAGVRVSPWPGAWPAVWPCACSASGSASAATHTSSSSSSGSCGPALSMGQRVGSMFTFTHSATHART